LIIDCLFSGKNANEQHKVI